MKKICLYLTALVLLSVLAVGCSKEKLNPNSVIVDRILVENAFDRWLYENYVKPYNVQIEYRFVCSDLPLEHNLVPADFDKSISLAQVMLFAAIEPYDVVTGSKAFNQYAFPKFINFVGSGAYNNNGTVTIGTAEDGIKVILYRVNIWNTDLSTIQHRDFYPMTAGGIRFFSTIHHELAHILHQRKPFTTEFGKISQLNYTGDEWNSNVNTLPVARQNGFISPYASSSVNEDFVETFAHFILTDQAWWDAVLVSAGPGAQHIANKLSIVESYMMNEWDIDMRKLREEIGNRIKALPETHFKTYNEF